MGDTKDRGKYSVDEMIEKYGIHYQPDELDKIDIQIEKLDSSNTNELKKIIADRRLKRQRDLLNGLLTGNAEEDHIEKLLDIALHEIDEQTSVKQSIETKAGILLAFFGVIVSVLFQSKDLLEFIKVISEGDIITLYKVILWIIELGWGITGLSVLVFAVITLRCQDYSVFLLDDDMLRVAEADKRMSIVSLIETAWHVANRNRVINSKKGKRCNFLLISIVIFAIITIGFFSLFLCWQNF